MPMVTPALIGARLRAAGGRQVAVVVALATAAVIPVVVAASAVITADGALGHGLAGLPVGERSVTVSYTGHLDPAQDQGIDQKVRSRLPALIDGPVRRLVQYRVLADSTGRGFVLAGTDGLASAVRVSSGRLPRSCTPTRCEVVVIGVPGEPPPTFRTGYALVVVGQAVRTDPLLLTGTFDPGPTVPIVLADGVDAVAANAPLALIQRSYGWVAGLDQVPIRRLGTQAWIATAGRIADQLQVDVPGLVLTTPGATIRDQALRADGSASRFGLLAGSCVILLLGAAFIGGAALRPNQLRFADALRRRGLGVASIRLVLAGEALAIVSLAAVTGLLVGAAVAAVLADRAGLPARDTAGHAVRSAAAADLGLALAALALLLLTLWPRTSRPDPVPERAGWRALSVAVGVGVLAVLLLVSRGDTTPDQDDPLTILLPALVLLCLGLIAARAWPGAVRIGFRLLPRRLIGARLGIAGISARPVLAAATVGLLAAAVGATGFAVSYRSTLLRGAADQAAFAVPLDARITPGSGLTPVLSLASVAEYQRLTPDVRAVPVLREAGSLRSGSDQATAVQALGIDPPAVSRLQRWPDVIGDPSARSVCAAIRMPVAPPGLRLPAGRTVRVHLERPVPELVVTAWIRADDGREQALVLTAGPNGTTLTGALPRPAGSSSQALEPWALTALSLSQPVDEATRRQHAIGEGDTAHAAPAGRIGLRALEVDGQPLSRPWKGWSAAGLKVVGDGERADLDYRLDASSQLITALGPSPGAAASPVPLPVAADPVTAAGGPLITLTLGGAPVRARVVATLDRFPTVTGQFVLADRSALSALLTRGTPGSGQPGELWLDVPGTGAGLDQARSRLAAPPFSGVQVQWSADLERALRADPVARGAVQLLLLVAVLTLLVALAALVLLVLGERMEDAEELYTWEANGVPPSALRVGLWVRAVLVAAIGVPFGVVGGLALTGLTARLVEVTATAQAAQPPLVPVTGLGTTLGAVLIGLALALAAGGCVAWASFREPVPALSGKLR
jgi:FtsX-like permease family protein